MSTKSLFKFIFYMGTYVMLALPVFRLHKLEKAALLNSKTKHLTFYHFKCPSNSIIHTLNTILLSPLNFHFLVFVFRYFTFDLLFNYRL